MNKPAIEWYEYLIDDCKSIIVETNHIIEWTRLEKYHELGKRILQDTDKAPHKELVQRVAQDLSLSKKWLINIYHRKIKRGLRTILKNSTINPPPPPFILFLRLSPPLILNMLKLISVSCVVNRQ